MPSNWLVAVVVTDDVADVVPVIVSVLVCVDDPVVVALAEMVLVSELVRVVAALEVTVHV